MWQFQPRTFIPWYLQIVSPLIAVFFTVLLGMGLFSFLGKDPFHAMHVFFISPLSDGYNIGELLVKPHQCCFVLLGWRFVIRLICGISAQKVNYCWAQWLVVLSVCILRKAL